MRSTDMIPVGVFAMMLIAIVGFMVILFTASQTGVIEEQPPATIQEIDAGQVAREFVFNWPKAMKSYQDQWFTVNAGPVNKVAKRRATIEYEGVTLKMYFNSQRRNLDNRARPGHNRRLQAHQRPGPQPKYHDERMPVARARTQIPPKKTIKNSNPGERP